MKKSIILFTVLFMMFSVLTAQTPQWEWAIKAGGSGSDLGRGISVDANGNSYVTGDFQGTATFGTTTLNSYGQSDIFVAKMDVYGNWEWAIMAGGSGSDLGYSISVDANGNSYVTGKFVGIATFGTTTLNGYGESDIFVAKLDANGTWQWAENAGGSSWDYGHGISVDANGNSYVTGYFGDSATFGAITLTSSGIDDIFVAKLDTEGNWQWAKNAGGIYFDWSQAISIDENGNSYITGRFQSTATFGGVTLTGSESDDIFVAKLDTEGNWQWAKEAGGSDADCGYGISVDANGNSYVTGHFMGIATFGATTLTSSGILDIFVAKIDASGNWQWAKKAGGISFDLGSGISVDANGNSYVNGFFNETATFGGITITSSGFDDIFVAKLNTEGNWQWAIKAGGSGWDEGWNIGVDVNGNSYVNGYFEDTATFGATTLTSSGNLDIFVAKIGNDTSVENEIITPINSLSNYPNPFNPETTISFFTTENAENTELIIYNIKGQKVKTLINEALPAGEHSILWDGKDESNNPVSRGIYFYKFNVNGKTEAVKKCLLLK